MQALPDTSAPNHGLLGTIKGSLGCVFLHLCEHLLGVFLQHSILKQAPSLNLALTSSARPAGQKAPGFLSSLPRQHMLLCLALMWVLGGRI